jgi:hypothetical protein
MTLHAGACLGPYEILEPLGAGGMGEAGQRVPVEIAAVHAVRGESAKAHEWLERGVTAGYKITRRSAGIPYLRAFDASLSSSTC